MQSKRLKRWLGKGKTEEVMTSAKGNIVRRRGVDLGGVRILYRLPGCQKARLRSTGCKHGTSTCTSEALSVLAREALRKRPLEPVQQRKGSRGERT